MNVVKRKGLILSLSLIEKISIKQQANETFKIMRCLITFSISKDGFGLIDY